MFSTFWLFDPLLGGQNDGFYWIYWIFSTFRLFDFLLGDQNYWFYWIYWFFSNLRLLIISGRLKCLIYWKYWIFSTFRLFDLLLGGQNDWSYWMHWIFYFSTFRPLGGRSKWSNLLNTVKFILNTPPTNPPSLKLYPLDEFFGLCSWEVLVVWSVVSFIPFFCFKKKKQNKGF